MSLFPSLSLLPVGRQLQARRKRKSQLMILGLWYCRFKKRKAAEEALREEKDRAKAAKRPVGGGGDDSSVFD